VASDTVYGRVVVERGANMSSDVRHMYEPYVEFCLVTIVRTLRFILQVISVCLSVLYTTVLLTEQIKSLKVHIWSTDLFLVIFHTWQCFFSYLKVKSHGH